MHLACISSINLKLYFDMCGKVKNVYGWLGYEEWEYIIEWWMKSRATASRSVGGCLGGFFSDYYNNSVVAFDLKEDWWLEAMSGL